MWELQNIHLKILMSLGSCFLGCAFWLGGLGFSGLLCIYYGLSYSLQDVPPTLPDFPEESDDVKEWVDPKK